MNGMQPPSSPNSVDKIKCVLLGDGAIGKTSLIVSYTTNGYPTEYIPTAFDNYSVVVTVDNRPLRLQLCDTAGQDDFDSLRPLCYPGTDVFLVCFSVVCPTSFHNIKEKWLPELKQHRCYPRVPFLLVGTQSDLRTDVKVLIELAEERLQPIPVAAAEAMAKQIGAYAYVESSALTQRNLKEVFDQALLAALDARIINHSECTSGRLTNGKGVFSMHSPGCSSADDDDYDTASFKDHAKAGWRKLCCLF